MAKRQGNDIFAAAAVGITGIAIIAMGVVTMRETTSSGLNRDVP